MQKERSPLSLMYKVRVETVVNYIYLFIPFTYMYVCMNVYMATYRVVLHINSTIQTVESGYQFREWERDKPPKTFLPCLFYSVYGFVLISPQHRIQLFIKLNLFRS